MSKIDWLGSNESILSTLSAGFAAAVTGAGVGASVGGAIGAFVATAVAGAGVIWAVTAATDAEKKEKAAQATALGFFTGVAAIGAVAFVMGGPLQAQAAAGPGGAQQAAPVATIN